jgi:SNF2 family DNA or RNA helicase
VIAPKRPATSTWPQEREDWTDFHELDVVVLHGKNKDELVRQRHDVYVINYEGMKWLVESGHLARMLKLGWLDTLVFDELSKMKNPDTRRPRYTLIAPYLSRFERRWGLTGSPAANGLINIFAQIRVLDLGHRLGRFVTHFRNRFCIPINQFEYVLKAGAADVIYAAIADIALRLDAEDYMELPELRPVTITVELPPDARKLYDEMDAEMVAMIQGERVTAGSAGVLSGKCRQIASGALYKHDIDPVTGARLRWVREWFEIHDEKLDALEDLVDELQGQQLLVGYEFNHDLQRILTRFPNTPYIGAGVTVKRALQIEADWNAGKIPLLLGHPASMGHGLNLQKSGAHHVCWYSAPWDFELYDQFIRRLRRRGNRSRYVFVHHLVARGTVEDGVVMPTLRSKEGEQRAFFDALKAYAEMRRAQGA